MISLRTGWLPALALAAAAVGWLCAVFLEDLALPTPSLGASGLITTAVVGVLCLGFGLRIRRDRSRPAAARLDPIAAARILVLAQAAGFAGALIGGWHAGVLVQLLSRSAVGVPVFRESLWLAVAGAALVVIGLVVESWCKIPPEGEGGDGPARQDGHEPRAPRGEEPGTQGGYARVRD